MENYKIKIFPRAKQDMEEVIDYLNTLSPDVALKYYDLLVEGNCRTFLNAGTMPQTERFGTGGSWVSLPYREKLPGFLCNRWRYGADS